MQFLVDQDVYYMTVEWLRKEGHDVVMAKQIGMERAADEELLKGARDMGRLLVTRDKGFGALAFLKREESPGVILLRGSPAVLDAIHHELGRLFLEHKEEELKRLFCVVEPHRHRIRYLAS
jgi:predicted nuclease of predicted toxin-antitoxin system